MPDISLLDRIRHQPLELFRLTIVWLRGCKNGEIIVSIGSDNWVK